MVMMLIGVVAAKDRLTHGLGTELQQIEGNRRLGHLPAVKGPIDPRHFRLQEPREGPAVATTRPIAVGTLLREAVSECAAVHAHVDQRMQRSPDTVIDRLRDRRSLPKFAVGEVSRAQDLPPQNRISFEAD